jgi:regulator of sigma E protease
MQMGQVVALRDGSPAEIAGVRSRNRDKNLKGDMILKVEVKNPDGKGTMHWGRVPRDGEGPPLDPVRLPDDLKQWAAQMAKAKVKDWKVTLHVQRQREKGGEEFEPEPKVLKLDWDNDWQYDKIQPFSTSSTSPQAIAELGLAYQVMTTVAYLPKEYVKNDGLKQYDVIEKVRFWYQPKPNGDWQPGEWTKLDPDEFAWVFASFQYPGSFKTKFMTVQVKRDKETKEIEIEAQQDPTWPMADRGLLFSRDVRIQKADNFFEAIGMGFKDTYDNMAQVYQNLRGMITGRISIKNLGGPITIARVAYKIAGYDFWEFLFFIGMISVNLAVINFLPIPVLDGGHMVFLIYEKIRGKPASEGVRVATTYAGLALILSLMVFVLYQDIWRIFRG